MRISDRLHPYLDVEIGHCPHVRSVDQELILLNELFHETFKLPQGSMDLGEGLQREDLEGILIMVG